jgi:hypothetical protein
MNNISETIEKIKQLTPRGVTYPQDLLSLHDISKPLDVENLKYLVNGGEAGGYFHWLTLLAMHSNAKLIVELGNRYGSSTIALYHGLRSDQRLITVDSVKDQRYVPKKIFNDSRVKFVFGDCLDLNSYISSDEPIPVNIDILWSDTVHYYEQISSEFYVYEPLLSDEALLVIDDIKLNDKGKFFRESPYKKYDLTDICHVSGFGVIHFVRPGKDRGMTEQERINLSILRAMDVWKRRYEMFYSNVDLCSLTLYNSIKEMTKRIIKYILHK